MRIPTTGSSTETFKTKFFKSERATGKELESKRGSSGQVTKRPEFEYCPYQEQGVKLNREPKKLDFLKAGI